MSSPKEEGKKGKGDFHRDLVYSNLPQAHKGGFIMLKERRGVQERKGTEPWGNLNLLSKERVQIDGLSTILKEKGQGEKEKIWETCVLDNRPMFCPENPVSRVTLSFSTGEKSPRKKNSKRAGVHSSMNISNHEKGEGAGTSQIKDNAGCDCRGFRWPCQ